VNVQNRPVRSHEKRVHRGCLAPFLKKAGKAKHSRQVRFRQKNLGGHTFAGGKKSNESLQNGSCQAVQSHFPKRPKWESQLNQTSEATPKRSTAKREQQLRGVNVCAKKEPEKKTHSSVSKYPQQRKKTLSGKRSQKKKVPKIARGRVGDRGGVTHHAKKNGPTVGCGKQG